MKKGNINFKRLMTFVIAATMCMTGLAFLPTASADCPSGMVGYWKLDETSAGPVVDCYGSNDGTNNGAMINQLGQVNTAYSFDGIDDYVEVSGILETDMDALTLSAWVNFDTFETTEKGHGIIVKNGYPNPEKSDFAFIVQGISGDKDNSYFQFGGTEDGSTPCDFLAVSPKFSEFPSTFGFSIDTDTWYLTTATYDRATATAKIYVNGVMVASDTSISGILIHGSDQPVWFGRGQEGHSYERRWMDGKIDEVAIYDRALSADEISSHYYAGLAGHGYCDCPDTVYVDDGYTQGSCGGYNWQYDAFDVIQDAIDAVCDGGTVYVAAGTYTNDIWDSSLGIPNGYRITKSLTFLGAQAGNDPAGSTDRGGETILVRTNGLPYSLYASDITIDGFMFGSSDPNTGGRLIISNDNAIIRNCIIQNTPSGSSGHGVYIYPGADNALVEYNTFYNTAWEAIASWQVSGAVISHNYISQSGQHAIQMMGHAGSNNEITYNHISGITGKNAIQYWGGPGVTISHNVIDGGNTMFDGIWLDYAADGSTVSNNQIFDTIYAGINVRGGCTNAVITYNDISGCGTAIETHVGATGASVNCNNIAGNSWGVSNYDSGLLNAENNWWGDTSGPTHSSNPSGIGDAVSDNVDYDPWAGKITGPTDPVEVDIPISVTGHFTCDMVNAEFDWGDEGTSSPYISLGDTSVTDSHTYTEAGVYTVTLTVDDDNGWSITMEFQYVVVYDPDAGFVTGGGWIYSPAGAYIPDPEAEGKANFGFVSKYKKGQSTPTGNTEFQFKAGNMNFHSNNYDWLVITHHKAMYKGTGTINGAGDFGFMLTAIDEKLTPSTDDDMFRIKIWDKDDSDEIVYDNNIGNNPDEDPTTAIGGGQIVIHKK